MASRLLNKLPSKWNPKFSGNLGSGGLDNNGSLEDGVEEERAIFTFNPDVTTQGCLAQGYRVFTELERGPHLPGIWDDPPREE